MGVSQIQIVTGIMGLIGEMAPEISVNTRQYNSIVKAANIVVDELRKPNAEASKAMRLEDWAKSDDVGMSSKYLAYKLSGDSKLLTEHALPRDPSDLYLCFKLIKAVPELKYKFKRFGAEDEAWRIILAQWNALEELMNEDNWKEINIVISYALEIYCQDS